MQKILVIGAGPVGATFALMARAQGRDVSLLDAREGPSTETRTLALSEGSRVLLARAGAWNWSAANPPAEIHAIHTSQKGGFGRVMLRREDAGVAALGYVVRYAALQAVLDEALVAAGIQTVYGANVCAIDPTLGEIRYTSKGVDHVAAGAVLVMADGGANLDKLPSVEVEVKDYGQSAMLAHVVADRPHANTAYERFTPQGPAALLPTPGARNEFSMVWVASHDHINELMALDDDEVRVKFQAHFGRRAGTFVSLTNRRRYPLKLRQTTTRVVGKLAIIGNAAQAMHPVAGQGFNLGLRDAALLAEQLAGPLAESDHAAGALLAYSASRDSDIARGVGFTDLLASAFMPDAATVRWPRGAALAAVDMLPMVRRALADRMLFGADR
jgi:2-octaprenyl-6-methoxyphenol hydroxylase